MRERSMGPKDVLSARALFPQCLAVYGKIFSSRRFPGKILAHGRDHQLFPPVRMLAVGIDGALDSIKEFVRSEVKKGKAVDAVFDGIGQASGQPDNGQGAVLQAVNLIQSAGLLLGQNRLLKWILRRYFLALFFDFIRLIY